MKIEFLEIAKTELDDAYQWYETQQKTLGTQFLNEIDSSIRRIAAYPEAFVSISNGVRRCLVKRFPYGILYGIDVDKIIIVAVAHLHRKPGYWSESLSK
jgi:plasmid stabilization system protein ParE